MKKTQLFIVIFIIVIMISSVIGFVYTRPSSNNQDPNSFSYKNFKFNPTSNGGYQVDLNGKTFIFDNLPQDLININLPNFNLEGDKYYLIMNPIERDENLNYNLNKLGYTLNLLNIKPVLACINENGCKEDLPIKNCKNNAFYFKKNNLSKIYLQDKCIIIEGDNAEMSKSIDKINLKLAGIE